ncbi:hypothetical protein HLH33_15465 [Gluconacetobacter diazotrophicus]|uniref:Uncharacterized protein n=1 Tax=Gluconacetobacter diazotrophicus TaxID=33996 RepID=A0A7W4NH86_GLUDI|nr:hypothetical protein [Gluconacetobacter diazotrophicus]MBB2157692.1 hypothetical protein [Gluconacetobacter diazotrophicus]
MTDTSPNTPRNDRIGGGGAATSAGIRFQQQLGALISSWILAGDRFDERFRLGAATPEWVRFETEAPVDDLLVKTSDGGFVAIQAKTTVSLSDAVDSPLGKTIIQFVRHWHVSNQGDGSMEWNRPLDPARDRLVLAVSPQASAQVRDDLPAALRLASQPGGGALNHAQQRAYEVFTTHVKRAWGSITTAPLESFLLADLSKLVMVFEFNGARGPALAGGSLVKTFGADFDAGAAFTALTDLSGRLMKERGGGDLFTWRNLLAGNGIALGAAPEYRDDIEALKQHSKRISEALGAYEKIEVDSGAPLTVQRDCQSAVEAAVRSGPLLIIGEPGAGKSGVLNALAKALCASGADVLELAVDRYSVESLEGLSLELGLKRPLLEVLEAWDGSKPAYLVVDALDATRGGRGEGVFRSLIERVLELKGRWNVVASIRNFDLRMGQQFRALFKGAPPERLLADPTFAGVRHIQVPSWSEAEFDQLLRQAPALAGCLAQAPARLHDLAMVPFNTRLLSELITGGVIGGLDQVSSQADLLRLYWEHRVDGHGLPARTSLSRVVQFMVQARALRAPAIQAAGNDPAMIDILCKEGILVVVDGGRWVQFRHHLLFDYAAAQLAFEPSDIVSGAYRFRKAEALGMMLSPALGFVLREIWETETDHARFWIALGRLINDEDGDPIIRSTAGRLGAEFPAAAEDCLWLGDLAISGDAIAPKTLSHVSGALIVRLEDEKNVPLEPWVFLAARMAKKPGPVAATLRFLLYNLIERIKDGPLTMTLGEAARALLAHGLAQQDVEFIVRPAIGFVIDTYVTDIAASRLLLAQLFTRERLDRFGHEELPAICYKIAALGAADPEFVTDIYRVVYDYEVTEDRQTQLGQSRILNFTSNARQDYGVARWSLGEYLPQFLERQPRAAVKAIVAALEGYLRRVHPVSEDALDVQLDVSGRTIRLREDHSYIWAHDPDDQYGSDAESLVSKLRMRLRDASEPHASMLVDLLIEEAASAIFWSRLFLCVVERGDGLLDRLWPFAAAEPFLVLPDTRKDAIDVVASGFGRRPLDEREAFERAALSFNFERFNYRDDARRGFLERVFTAIGRDNLTTGEAREIVDAKAQDVVVDNKRLFVIQSSGDAAEDFHWIENLDRTAPGNVPVITAINGTKTLLRLEAGSDEIPSASLAEALTALVAIQSALAADTLNAGLRQHAEAIIGQGCHVIVSRKLLASDPAPTPEQDTLFLDLWTVASQSKSPEINDATEERFEEFASWGGPAARVEAAEAAFDLVYQRPDLYHIIYPLAEPLLTDPHPAVRLNAAVRIGRIWDIDRAHFWRLIAQVLESEQNLTVIEHVLNDLVSLLVHSEPARTVALLLALLHREPAGSDRVHRVRKSIADKLSVLWITYQSQEAKAILDGWLTTPWDYPDEVRTILTTLREAVVAGIGDDTDKDAGLRQRSRELVSTIVDAANARLAVLISVPNRDADQTKEARECVDLLDVAGNTMYFATNAAAGERDSDPEHGNASLDVFFRDNVDLLKRIATYATPQTTHRLLQLVERLVNVDPASAFDLAVRFLQAGRQSGYQNESLGVDLLVKLVGVFLADHKEIFEDADRRAALVDCLETFLEAGWPTARRLLYRLPELIQ